jgi:hypothetical protein
MSARLSPAVRAARQREMLRWAGGLGAVTAEALAAREGQGDPGSARSRLSAAQSTGLMAAWPLLQGRPALYTVTRAGLRAAGAEWLEPARVSAAGAAHAAACAVAAVGLAARYPGHEVLGEPAIRAACRGGGAPFACPVLSGPGTTRTHRPDLVLLPRDGGAPVAVEVELTVKSPERLTSICRGWARERSIAGVVYLAPEHVRAAVGRAVERAGARESVLVLPL